MKIAFVTQLWSRLGRGGRGERHIVSRGLNGEENEKQRGVDRLGGSLASSRWKAIHDRWEGGMNQQGIGKDHLVTCSARG